MIVNHIMGFCILVLTASASLSLAEQASPLRPGSNGHQLEQSPVTGVLKSGVLYSIAVDGFGGANLMRSPLDPNEPKQYSRLSAAPTSPRGIYPVRWAMSEGFVWVLIENESEVFAATVRLTRYAVADLPRLNTGVPLDYRHLSSLRLKRVPPSPLGDAIFETSRARVMVYGSFVALSESSVRLFVLKPGLMMVWENKDPAIPDQSGHSRKVEGITNDKDRIENWSKVASIDVPFSEPFEAVRSDSSTYFVTESGDVYAAGDLKGTVRKLDIGAKKITAILTDDGKHKTYLIAANDYATLSDTPAFQPIDPTPDAKALTPQESVMGLARKLK